LRRDKLVEDAGDDQVEAEDFGHDNDNEGGG
jgi:hypothetical protein